MRVWDKLGGADGAKAGRQDEATWVAVNGLHARQKKSKHRDTLSLPAQAHNSLSPARRLHKICKGAVTSQRSSLALSHVDAAVAWVARQRAEVKEGGECFLDSENCKGKFKIVKALVAGLPGVNKETARGLVTKLKMRKVIGPNSKKAI